MFYICSDSSINHNVLIRARGIARLEVKSPLFWPEATISHSVDTYVLGAATHGATISSARDRGSVVNAQAT